MGGGPIPDSTYVDVRGGWHDAGDQLKYLNITASNATARMIMAYQMNRLICRRVWMLWEIQALIILLMYSTKQNGEFDWILKLHPAPDQLIHMVGMTGITPAGNSLWMIKSNYGWGKKSYRL